MVKKLKIDREEVEKVLEDRFNIKDIKLMRTNSYESDSELCEQLEYIEGEIVDLSEDSKVLNVRTAYKKNLAEIFENLYHQEDEGDFTPLSALVKIEELVDEDLYGEVDNGE